MRINIFRISSSCPKADLRRETQTWSNHCPCHCEAVNQRKFCDVPKWREVNYLSLCSRLVRVVETCSPLLLQVITTIIAPFYDSDSFVTHWKAPTFSFNKSGATPDGHTSLTRWKAPTLSFSNCGATTGGHVWLTSLVGLYFCHLDHRQTWTPLWHISLFKGIRSNHMLKNSSCFNVYLTENSLS